MPRNQLKFLHIADLHLDRSFSGGRLKLPFEKSDARRRDLREVFGRAIDLAKEEKVDIVLIAGDFWEEDEITPETAQFVFDKLGSSGLPVAIAPGNHDYYSVGSHYSEDIVFARFGRNWPENVLIFRNYDLETFTHPLLPDVSITGLAFHSNQRVTVRKIGEKVLRASTPFHIGLIHGSRDDYLPPGQERTLPFSDAELLAQPFDYTALGHYHVRSEIVDDMGRIRGAYTGSTACLNIDETGSHGVLVGTIRDGGVSPADFVFHELDRRHVQRIELDITGKTHPEAIEALIAHSADNAGVGSNDMVLIELRGTYPQGSRINLNEEKINSIAWHVRVDSSAILPEWNRKSPEDLSPRTTEALYRSRILKLLEDAATRGNPAEAERLQNALYYGLDALHGRSINPRRT